MTDILTSAYEDERRRLDEEQERIRSRLNIVDDAAGGLTPDDAATIDRARSLQPGQPPPVTRAEADAAIRAYQADRALSVSPRLQRYLADPTNAAMARDDTESLSFWDHLGDYLALTPLGAPAEAARLLNGQARGQRPIQRAVRAFEQGQRNVRMAELADSLNPSRSVIDPRPRRGDEVSGWFELQRMRQTPNERFRGIDAAAEQLPQLWGSLQETFMSSARGGARAWRQSTQGLRDGVSPQAVMAASYAPYAWLVGSGAGGLQGMLGYTERQEAGAAFDEMLQARDQNGGSIPVHIAGAYARRVGEINAAIEFVGLATAAKVSGAEELGQYLLRPTLRRALSRMAFRDAARRLTVGVVGSGLEEGLTELTQEGVTIALGQLAQEASGGEWEQLSDDEIAGRLWESFSVGATVGAIFGGVPAGGRFISDMNAIQEADYQQEVFSALADSAQGSRLRERAPDRYADAVNTLTANGPISEVAVDADRFLAYFQERGQDPFEVADNLRGVGAEALRAALDTGNELTMPMGTYASQIAGGPADMGGLREHVRMGPGQMTAAEVKARIELGVDLERAVGEAGRLMEEAGERLAESEGVRERLQTLFDGAEVYTPEASRRFAEYYTAAVTTMASRAGITPTELLDQIGLSVEGPFDALKAEEDLQQGGRPMGADAGPVRTDSWAPPDGVSMSERMRKIVEMARNGASNEWIADEMSEGDNLITTQNISVTLSQAKVKLGAAVWEEGSGRGPGRPPPNGVTIGQIMALRAKLIAQGVPLRNGPTSVGTVNSIIARRFGLDPKSLRVRISQELFRRKRSGEDSRALYQFGGEASTPVWFSALTRTIEQSKTAKAPAAQWWATISKAPGVRKDELEWIGLKEWLDEQTKPVTREAVLDFVQANGIQVEETVLGEAADSPDGDSEVQRRLLPLLEERQRLRDEQAQQSGAMPATRMVEIDGRIDVLDQEIEALYAKRDQSGGATKWSQYTLPGGENYREVLLRLPERIGSEDPRLVAARALNAKLIEKYGGLNAAFDHWTEAERVEFDRVHGEAQQAPPTLAYPTFKSSHWDQPNIIAHIRFKERVDAEGRRTLFIEEVQSDWHQAGRERGYKGGADIQAIEAKLRDAGVSQQAIDGLKRQQNPPDAAWTSPEVVDRVRATLTPEELARFRAETGTQVVPDAPFKNNAWASLAMKRMIRWAAENGFEQIAWTRGQHQVERFNLAEHVETIRASVGAYKDSYHVIVDGKDGRNVLPDGRGGRVRSAEMNKADIVETFGQELGQRLIDGADNYKAKEGMFEVAGDGLQIGGSGMRAFYDKILPNIANDIGKKFGAKTSETQIEVGAIDARNGWETAGGSPRSAKPAGIETVHALPITPELREAAMQGQALFQPPKRTGPAGAILMPHMWEGGDLRRATIKLFEGRDLSTPLHEGGHLFLEVMQALASKSEQIAEDLQTVFNWFGVTAEQWSAMSLEEKRPYHEQFARANEAYLMTSEAPSNALKQVFSVFKRWLTWIYKSVLALDVNITPEMREVFDRLVATDDAIAEARTAQGAGSRDITPRERFGGTDKQYERYLANIEIAREAALEDLQKEAMGALIADRTRWWRSEENKARRTVIAEMDEEPEWQAYDALSGRKIPDGASEPIRLSPAIVLEAYGQDVLDALPPEIARADVDTLLAQAVEARKTLRAREPTRFTARVQQLGGVRDTNGDVKAIIGDARARPGLINNATGLDPDEMALRLWEEGYFGTPPGRLFQGKEPSDANSARGEGSEGAKESALIDLHHGGAKKFIDEGPGGRHVFLTPRRDLAETYGEVTSYRLPRDKFVSPEDLRSRFNNNYKKARDAGFIGYWQPMRTGGQLREYVVFDTRALAAHSTEESAIAQRAPRQVLDFRTPRGEMHMTVRNPSEADLARLTRENPSASSGSAVERGVPSEARSRIRYIRDGDNIYVGNSYDITHRDLVNAYGLLKGRANAEDGVLVRQPDGTWQIQNDAGAAPMPRGWLRGEIAQSGGNSANVGMPAQRGSARFNNHLLSPQQNKAVEMLRNGYTGAEIADELGVQVKTVDSILGQARDRIGAELVPRRPMGGKVGRADGRGYTSADLLRMHEAEGLNPPEISERTGVPLGSVRARLSQERARRAAKGANGGPSIASSEAEDTIKNGGWPLFQGERPTVREFLDKLDGDVRGTQPVYRQDDQDAVAAREEAARVKEYFAQQGVDITAKESELREQIAKIAAREDTQGVDPDLAASIFGFDTGEELLKALANLRPRREVIEERTRQRMLQAYGDPFATGEVMDSAMKAAHRDAQAKVIEMELDAIERAIGVKEKVAGVSRPVSRAAKDVAEQQIGRMTVRQIRKHEWFLANERRHAKEAMKAIEDGDLYAARLAKHRQLVNFHLYRLARKAAEELDRAQRYFRKFERNGVRQNIDGDYLDQIDQILEGYELRNISRRDEQRRIALSDFVARMVNEGREDELSIDPRVIARSKTKPFAQLDLDQVRGLVDTIKNIEHLGRTKDKLIERKKQREFRASIQEMTDALNRTGPINSATRANFSPNALQRTVQWAVKWNASLTRLERLFQFLDGEPNGPLTRSLWQVFEEAAGTEFDLMRPAVERMNAVWANYTSAEKARLFTRRFSAPELASSQHGSAFTKAEMLSLALNWGTESGRAAIMDGYGWSEENVQAALDRLLDERDWQTVQSIWSTIGTLREPAFSLHEEVTGVRPVAVEGVPVSTPFGTIQGQYFPLKYDGERDERVNREEEAESVQQIYASQAVRAMTRQGHLERRVGSGGRPVKLSMTVFTEHMKNVIHDIAYRKAVISVGRIIRDRQFTETFKNVAGQSLYRELMPWLKEIANPRVDPAVPLVGDLGKLRGNISMAVMGWKIGVSLQQHTGYLNAITHLGAGDVARTLARVYGRPDKLFELANLIESKSVYMRDRRQTFDRDVREAIEKMEKADPLYPIREHAFTLIGYMDWAVSGVTWLAAYDKARAGRVKGIDGFEEADAIAYADQAVRATQGSGRVQDLPRIMRSGPMLKLFTMFYNYGNMLYNWTIYDQVLPLMKGRISPVTFTGNLFLVYVVGYVLAEVLAGRGAPRDDEGDDERNARLATGALLSPFSTVVGLRDIVAAAGMGYDYQISPAGSALGTIADTTRRAATGDLDSDYAQRQAAMALGYSFGLPSSQAYIMLDYMRDKLEGSEDGFDPVEAMVADRR